MYLEIYLVLLKAQNGDEGSPSQRHRSEVLTFKKRKKTTFQILTWIFDLLVSRTSGKLCAGIIPFHCGHMGIYNFKGVRKYNLPVFIEVKSVIMVDSPDYLPPKYIFFMTTIIVFPFDYVLKAITNLKINLHQEKLFISNYFICSYI